MYTSLFKKDDVRVTQAFSSSHKGIDLSRGVVRQPIYLPNKAVSGTVWKILPSYSTGGVYYPDSPIIYIKHADGSGSRYIHSYPKDVKVKVGDTVLFGKYSGTSVKVDGKEVLIMKEEEILGILQ